MHMTACQRAHPLMLRSCSCVVLLATQPVLSMPQIQSAPTCCCTSFFHTAFGAEGAQRWTTESNALQHAVSAASGSSPAVAEQQSCSALMACCHAATVLPDMPTSAQHALLFTALHQTGKMV